MKIIRLFPLAALAIGGCQPTVKVEAPDKPIVINLNVHIDQEVKIKVDQALDSEFKDHPELFGPASAKAGTKK